jgi:hypothetical protein
MKSKSETITIQALCDELKIAPRIAREKLRVAVREPKRYPELAKSHKPREAWSWAKGSPAEKEARVVLQAPASNA